MAFFAPMPGPIPVKIDTAGISQIGDTIAQNRKDAAIRDVFANLRSDDPASIDEAERRLMQIDPALGIRYRESRLQAAARAATQKLAEQAGARSEEQLKMQRQTQGWAATDRAKAEANEAAARAEAATITGDPSAAAPATSTRGVQPPPMDTQRLDQLIAPEAVPQSTPPTAPAPQSTAPQTPAPTLDTNRLDRLLTPGPGSALDVPPGGGVDISAARKGSAAPPTPTTGLPNPANLNEEQAARVLGLDVGGPGYKAAVQRRLDYFKDLRKEKDKETEAAAAVTGKTLGETLKEKGSLLSEANKQLYNIEREEQIVRGGTPTGLGAGVRDVIDRALLSAQSHQKALLGWETPDYLKETYNNARRRAADYQELQGIKVLSVYEMLQGFGKGTTNEERQEMAKLYSDVEKSEGGNLASIRFRKGIILAKKEEAEVFQRYIAQQRQLGKPPRQDEIEYLTDKVQEKHLTKLRAQAQADREQYLSGTGTKSRGTQPSEQPQPTEDRGPARRISPAALNHLRRNPDTAEAFESFHGLPRGAAQQLLGGGR